MSYAHWHVGMKVVCLYDNDEPSPNPIAGEIYTVSYIYADDYDGIVMIDLAELPNPESVLWLRGYEAGGFRPVQERKTDISIFTAMLTPVKKGVDA